MTDLAIYIIGFGMGFFLAMSLKKIKQHIREDIILDPSKGLAGLREIDLATSAESGDAPEDRQPAGVHHIGTEKELRQTIRDAVYDACMGNVELTEAHDYIYTITAEYYHANPSDIEKFINSEIEECIETTTTFNTEFKDGYRTACKRILARVTGN